MSQNGTPRLTAVQQLRKLLADKNKTIVCPGVYDGFTARIALEEGFDCLYMTGAGTTMSRLGQADLGVATMNDMRDNASMIANIDPSVPLIADADTGYGGAIMVGRTVTQYIVAGVAGLHLEDQVVSKRCGHLKNKEVVDEETFLSRIRAAVMARESSHGDIVIIARTDALQALGYDAAVSRLKNAIAVGADVAFLEGIETAEQGKTVCEELAPIPCLFNQVPGGASPDLSVEEARELGYRIVLFPGLALAAVYPAVKRAVKELKERGKVKVGGESGGPKALFEVCGLREAMEFDVRAGGKGFLRGA